MKTTKEVTAIWARLEEGSKQSIQDAKDMCLMLTSPAERIEAMRELQIVLSGSIGPEPDDYEKNATEPPCCECGSPYHDCQHCPTFDGE